MRAPITIEVKSPTGVAVSGASISVVDRSSGSAATLYAAETGPTTVPNPMSTDAAGRATAWVDRGAYIASVSGSGIANYSVPFDATPGEDRSIDALWLPAGSDIPRVTSLPTTNLIDGMEVFYVADASAAVLWRLKYNEGSASAYKWEYVGGPPLYKTGAAYASGTTTYHDFNGAGPNQALALAGDYMVTVGTSSYIASGGNAGAGSAQAQISFAVGATAPVDAEGFSLGSYNDGGGNYTANGGIMTTRKNAIPAASTIGVRGKQINATNGRTSSYGIRWLSIVPVRVG